MTRILVFLACLVTSAAAGAAALDRISNSEASSGLKQALTDGSAAAVAQLGAEGGFLNNPKVRIPLPPALQRIETALRYTGMKRQADELVVAMNRAAEAAMPEARTLLVDAVKKMGIQDAKAILTGGDTAATQYFRKTSHAALHDRFLPVVKAATEKVGVAQRYRELAQPAAAFGLVKAEDADLDEYVTLKTLDGLYFMLGEEEKKIRKDPVGTGSAILRRVFGAL